MIDHKEVRIGNTLKSSDSIKLINVFHIDEDDDRGRINYIGANNYEPVELTPDILEAAGFGVNKDNSFGYINENEGILIELGDFDEEFGRRVFYYVLPDTDDYTCIAYCKHLHQLQNLYFALTGEELKIDITKLNK